MSQSTITENRADYQGGGIRSIAGAMIITNSIVAQNTDNGAGPDLLAPGLVTVAFSLIGKNTGTGLSASLTPDANGNLIGDANGIDPRLALLTDNGRPTQTRMLLPDSPALDRGSNDLAVDITLPGNPTFVFDQGGSPFLRIANSTVDMGAVERQSLTTPIVVDITTDEQDGDFSPGDLSLREAIQLANGSAGPDAIIFAPSTNGTPFVLTLGQLEITEGLTITGNGAANTVIDAQQLSRIFDITSTVGDVTLSSLALSNGKTTAPQEQGGVLRFLSNGKLTVGQSVFSGNSTSGAYAHGGAIYSATGAVSVSNSTLSGNSTSGFGSSGGAIFVKTGALNVNQSTLSGNFTTNSLANGGAIASAYGAVTLNRSTLSGNSTAGQQAKGGGLHPRWRADDEPGYAFG